jgi:hypothetical protein
MRRMNIDFLEMRTSRFEHRDVSESHRHIAVQGDPEMAVALCPLQFVEARGLRQDRFRGMAAEQCGRRELDGGN